MTRIVSTTILAVRRGENVVLAGDGQVTLDTSIMKADAVKIRALMDGKVLCGFAGGGDCRATSICRFPSG